MKNHLCFPIHPLLAAAYVVGGLLVLIGSAYGITRAVSQEEIIGRVEVAGTSIGGLTRDEALTTLVALEDAYVNRDATFTINGSRVILEPSEAGFDMDTESIVDAAMRTGREGNTAFQITWWLKHIFSTTDVQLIASIDAEATDAVLNEWETNVIDMPVNLGALVITDGVLQPIYPEAGAGMARTEAAELMLASFLTRDPINQVLPTQEIIPKLTDADIDTALLEANRLLNGPIRMIYDDRDLVFTKQQLTEAFLSETIAGGSPQIINSFDPGVIDKYLQPVRADFEAEPINAEFVISEDEISVQPGMRGTRIDENEIALRLFQAGLITARIGQLTLVEDADPDVTTESLEDLGIRHLVSSFTTFHPCCADRVVNIQTMADKIDGHILMQGDEFSINEFVGLRLAGDGYLPAGTIIAGQIENSVGGGVSQFATTMYNAVFWGGYEDIEHKAHSYYFSRYPEGIEATVNWRTPDLRFRNNTSAAIMIDTQHTRDSITVRIFGDNDGRILKGNQRSGSTNISIVAEGGPSSIHVQGTVSERYAVTSPLPPLYVPIPEFEVDQIHQTQSEGNGWSVTVKRTLLLNGVDLIEEQEWVVRYASRFAVFEVHPCMVPGQEETCPSTTTPETTTPTG